MSRLETHSNRAKQQLLHKLAKVRVATKTKTISYPKPEIIPLATAKGEDPLYAQFCAEFTHNDGHILSCKHDQEFANHLTSVLQQATPPMPLAAEPQIAGKLGALCPQLGAFLDHPAPTPPAPAAKLPQASFDNAYVCAPRWAIAETGSLVLVETSQAKLSAVMLATHLFAVLRKQDVIAFADDVIAQCASSRAIVMLSGPSRSADIEQTLFLGIHGPVHVWAVFIEHTDLRD